MGQLYNCIPNICGPQESCSKHLKIGNQIVTTPIKYLLKNSNRETFEILFIQLKFKKKNPKITFLLCSQAKEPFVLLQP